MECNPSDIVLAATVCRFLSVVSDGKIPLMTDKRTDFMMIALASWMQSIHKTCCTPVYEVNAQYNMPVSHRQFNRITFYTRFLRMHATIKYFSFVSDMRFHLGSL